MENNIFESPSPPTKDCASVAVDYLNYLGIVQNLLVDVAN
jgi:hypothetical protein